MIAFEPSDSPYFLSNKSFVELNLKELSEFDFHGWCNVYGMDITGTALMKNRDCTIRFIKSQTTQNGIFIPVDSHIQTEFHIEIKGLDPDLKFSNRYFWLDSDRNLSKENLKEIDAFVFNYKVDKMSIKNGKLKLSIYNSDISPVELFRELERFLQ